MLAVFGTKGVTAGDIALVLLSMGVPIIAVVAVEFGTPGVSVMVCAIAIGTGAALATYGLVAIVLLTSW